MSKRESVQPGTSATSGYSQSAFTLFVTFESKFVASGSPQPWKMHASGRLMNVTPSGFSKDDFRKVDAAGSRQPSTTRPHAPARWYVAPVS